MRKIASFVQRIQLGLGMLFLTIFLVAVLIQIFTRYLRIAVIWTDDVAMYAFAWAVFMGGAAMVFPKKHFAFEFLSLSLTGKKKEILGIIISLLMMIFTIAMFIYGNQAVRVFWNHNWISIPAMKMGYTWLCVPIAGATMSLYLISHIVDHISVLIGKGATE